MYTLNEVTPFEWSMLFIKVIQYLTTKQNWHTALSQLWFLLLWKDIITTAILIKGIIYLWWFTVLRFSQLTSWWESRQHSGRYGAGEGGASFDQKAAENELKHYLLSDILPLTRPYLIQQDHTPPNSVILLKGHFISHHHRQEKSVLRVFLLEKSKTLSKLGNDSFPQLTQKVSVTKDIMYLGHRTSNVLSRSDLKSSSLNTSFHSSRKRYLSWQAREPNNNPTQL